MQNFITCCPVRTGENSMVQIYDTAGRLVQTTTTNGEGNLILPLDGLRANIYIIKTQNTTLKIQKR